MRVKDQDLRLLYALTEIGETTRLWSARHAASSTHRNPPTATRCDCDPDPTRPYIGERPISAWRAFFERPRLRTLDVIPVLGCARALQDGQGLLQALLNYAVFFLIVWRWRLINDNFPYVRPT